MFAHVPPPEHGQSKMVALMLDALRKSCGSDRVVHVDCRYSNTLDDVGGISVKKLVLTFKYVFKAIFARVRGARVLYYVPAPVKWGAVVRDWVVLLSLRPLFPKVIFHWHAIGLGSWAHGAQELSLPGPKCFDRIARRVTRLLVDRPTLSISVSKHSVSDARAVKSRRDVVVPNGLADPFESDCLTKGTSHSLPVCRILFLGRGTREKGVFDALAALRLLIENDGLADFNLEFTLAGGLPSNESETVIRLCDELEALGSRIRVGAVVVKRKGYVTGRDKATCYGNADLFIAPSHWESFGLTVVEAMAWEVPVVAAASPGVSGVLPDDYEWLVQVGDTVALADVLLKACGDVVDGRAKLRGKKLRDVFLTEFSLTKFEERICDELFSV